MGKDLGQVIMINDIINKAATLHHTCFMVLIFWVPRQMYDGFQYCLPSDLSSSS
jgi:hypothetical protein